MDGSAASAKLPCALLSILVALLIITHLRDRNAIAELKEEVRRAKKAAREELRQRPEDSKEGLVVTPRAGAWINNTGCEVRLRPPLTRYMRRGNPPRFVNLARSSIYALMKTHGAADALTVLDVGAHEPFVLSQLTWIPTKVRHLASHTHRAHRASPPSAKLRP